MSETVTHGIRIKVSTKYELEHSDPGKNNFIYSYHVVIRNESDDVVTLISRHWIISNSSDRTEQVRGIGVVGETPTIYPGDSFQYSSFCPLDTEWGTMEGSYQMQKEDGSIFDAIIDKFLLTRNEIIH